MEQETKGLSRRGFLKTSAAGVAGFAALGMLGGCAAPNAPTLGLPEVWDQEADVVVLGFGCAGGMAAVQAAQSGSSVIVLEKMSKEYAGGSSCCHAGSMAEPDAEGVASLFVSNSLGTVSAEAAQKRAEGAVEAFAWCVENGMAIARNGREVEGGAAASYAWLAETVNALENTQVLYDTPAVSLILDPQTKEVRGVNASQDGAEIAVKARKGIIVATGDYAANKDLMQTLHWPKLHIVSCGSPANTGDGMMMASAAGAQVKYIANACVDLSDMAYRIPSDEMGTGISGCWYSRTDAYTPDKDSSTLYNSMIFVNMEGNRFMNEKARLQHSKSHNAMLDLNCEIFDPNKDYINLPMFMVCDQNHIASGSIGKPAKASEDDPPYMWAPTKNVYTWSDDNQAEIEKGWILKADTLEGLAAKMTATAYVTGESKTVPADALIASIERYNTACGAGVDEFGRPIERMKPIDTPPFYAIEMCPSALYALGWLASDGDGQVLDWNDEPMSRLYCAGNAGQGSYFGAVGLNGCQGMGWVAGKHAASLEAWDAEKAG